MVDADWITRSKFNCFATSTGLFLNEKEQAHTRTRLHSRIFVWLTLASATRAYWCTDESRFSNYQNRSNCRLIHSDRPYTVIRCHIFMNYLKKKLSSCECEIGYTIFLWSTHSTTASTKWTEWAISERTQCVCVCVRMYVDMRNMEQTLKQTSIESCSNISLWIASSSSYLFRWFHSIFSSLERWEKERFEPLSVKDWHKYEANLDHTE